ncbi:hypothetical protein KNP414_05689 [Paenibacillus mucilaginosus KNP414]|uniref:Uncharacterized protein n=1 Tax=Paenibacillus mucilaginosus (strain KNP414) TaxID=1036673 RepID=F8FMP2_PAEMK|nr:hypothetical protein KNP414_05689 [Paenibacillus mucilaginosus KNP414]
MQVWHRFQKQAAPLLNSRLTDSTPAAGRRPGFATVFSNVISPSYPHITVLFYIISFCALVFHIFPINSEQQTGKQDLPQDSR